MSHLFALSVAALLCLLTLAAYIDRIYFEIGKVLSREYTDNIEAWEGSVEPLLKLSRESAALSASVLRQIALLALGFLLTFRLYGRGMRTPAEIGRTVLELLLVIVFFDRLLPQLFFTRTRGQWLVRIRPLVQGMFYLVLPVTLTIGLLLSIAGLAEPEAETEETPGEAMDALLEAGEEEGILEESDRKLMLGVVEFGDKVVREVMTPRPEMFAVPETMTLAEFTAAVNEHGFSRVPVYRETLDHITGVAFARDLLGVKDTDADSLTVVSLQREPEFVPETKKVNELLREMQREKQHMSVVIDEYGGVAGLVTIEDLLETIVGDITDEHDEPEPDDVFEEPDGAFLVPGSFDAARLRELFGEAEGEREGAEGAGEGSNETGLTLWLSGYDATTVGGLVSEIAGHIPLPGEVVQDGPLRMEVVASTDRLVERVRVRLAGSAEVHETE
jgi:putative hemolysin